RPAAPSCTNRASAGIAWWQARHVRTSRARRACSRCGHLLALLASRFLLRRRFGSVRAPKPLPPLQSLTRWTKAGKGCVGGKRWDHPAGACPPLGTRGQTRSDRAILYRPPTSGTVFLRGALASAADDESIAGWRPRETT